jgi:hypothetical protein
VNAASAGAGGGYAATIASRAFRHHLPLAILPVLACLSGCGSAAPHGGPIAWLNRPLALYVAPPPALIPYPTSAPPCRAAQLRVSQGRGGVGLGNELDKLVFTNLGPGPCLLRGYPTISATTADGARQQLHPRRGGTYFGQLSAADLPVGGHVLLFLATADGVCAGGVRYHDLAFTLPQGGGILTAGSSVSVTDDCFLNMSDFGLRQRYSQPGPAGAVGTLTARAAVPASARAGSTLDFIVTLTNPTAEAVALRPCPGYTMGFYNPRKSVHQSYALNCAAAPAIAAHGHERYEMRLHIPGQAAPGPAKFYWSVDNPQLSPAADRIIEILAR